ncbi:UPF0223 family protein [Virgibacillus halodenitrificans]|jgi:uncharacterized protein YktA (UPF0223 family)|uniref:UPF0223 protein BME96_11440 n=1 Tax=Virgibacillus halodenitrificans TaxID=1482 RepID=A0AAC9J0A2_VIRHA|nr:UPF0223 family protein [Virgibacillus halodenitrificans]APC48763.1 hypothetical protein BME96_11440 [Virgibacillus halodenitrificans]MBD1224421.1 UPF0223 family protein [Virgibacillus halodenitrificans]MCG1029786.1 UPF0223 family protein [Virgibacillus halodenitrificans]MCJ0931343.1 UPF0223 family protein [Virgibacillus halodenitrificans]MYL47826.1 hypothetical protein [Virgibacillus halodenitrificans]
MSYHYPIDDSWTTQEIIDVVQFFSLIEQAYEKGAARQDIALLYRKFKQIVPSKSEEKKLFANFQQQSGYSSFQVVKKLKETEQGIIKMKEGHA